MSPETIDRLRKIAGKIAEREGDHEQVMLYATWYARQFLGVHDDFAEVKKIGVTLQTGEVEAVREDELFGVDFIPKLKTTDSVVALDVQVPASFYLDFRDYGNLKVVWLSPPNGVMPVNDPAWKAGTLFPVEAVVLDLGEYRDLKEGNIPASYDVSVTVCGWGSHHSNVPPDDTLHGKSIRYQIVGKLSRIVRG